MKKLLVVLLAACMVIGLVACSNNGKQQTTAAETTAAPAETQAATEPAGGVDHTQGEKVAITIACGAQTSAQNQYKNIEEIAEQLETLSGGRIQVTKIDPGMQGNSREAVTSLQTGVFDIFIGGDMEYDMVLGTLGWSYTPYLTMNYEQADEYYYNGWVNEKLTELMLEGGLVKIGNAENGNRVCGMAERPIASMADFKGAKIRTPEIADVVAFYTKCGATPTSISTSEVAMAMQQGICDGADNSIQNMKNTGILDMIKYVTKTNHMYTGGSVCANVDFWNGLSAEDQAFITEVVETASVKYMAAFREEEAALFDLVEVIEPDDEFKKQLVAVGLEIWEENKSKWSDDIVALVDEQLAKNAAQFK